MRLARTAAWTLVPFGALNALALEQSSGGLAIDSYAEQVVVQLDEQGVAHRRLARAQTVHPGDVLIYTVRFTNTTDMPIRAPVVIKAIPREMRYVEDSAVGPASDISFSIDGGQTWGHAGELEVVVADGLVRPARAEDFTHIRWQLKYALGPGSSGYLRFRARLR